ncbi:unnamed protein product [Pedinophyceae sp. YPF-701]|nr:unnamed protein product [Pedinophyceae sp. YPF-701]
MKRPAARTVREPEPRAPGPAAPDDRAVRNLVILANPRMVYHRRAATTAPAAGGQSHKPGHVIAAGLDRYMLDVARTVDGFRDASRIKELAAKAHDRFTLATPPRTPPKAPRAAKRAERTVEDVLEGRDTAPAEEAKTFDEGGRITTYAKPWVAGMRAKPAAAAQDAGDAAAAAPPRTTAEQEAFLDADAAPQRDPARPDIRNPRRPYDAPWQVNMATAPRRRRASGTQSLPGSPSKSAVPPGTERAAATAGEQAGAGAEDDPLAELRSRTEAIAAAGKPGASGGESKPTKEAVHAFIERKRRERAAEERRKREEGRKETEARRAAIAKINRGQKRRAQRVLAVLAEQAKLARRPPLDVRPPWRGVEDTEESDARSPKGRRQAEETAAAARAAVQAVQAAGAGGDSGTDVASMLATLAARLTERISQVSEMLPAIAEIARAGPDASTDEDASDVASSAAEAVEESASPGVEDSSIARDPSPKTARSAPADDARTPSPRRVRFPDEDSDAASEPEAPQRATATTDAEASPTSEVLPGRVLAPGDYVDSGILDESDPQPADGPPAQVLTSDQPDIVFAAGDQGESRPDSPASFEVGTEPAPVATADAGTQARELESTAVQTAAEPQPVPEVRSEPSEPSVASRIAEPQHSDAAPSEAAHEPLAAEPSFAPKDAEPEGAPEEPYSPVAARAARLPETAAAAQSDGSGRPRLSPDALEMAFSRAMDRLIAVAEAERELDAAAATQEVATAQEEARAVLDELQRVGREQEHAAQLRDLESLMREQAHEMAAAARSEAESRGQTTVAEVAGHFVEYLERHSHAESLHLHMQQAALAEARDQRESAVQQQIEALVERVENMQREAHSVEEHLAEVMRAAVGAHADAAERAVGEVRGEAREARDAWAAALARAEESRAAMEGSVAARLRDEREALTAMAAVLRDGMGESRRALEEQLARGLADATARLDVLATEKSALEAKLGEVASGIAQEQRALEGAVAERIARALEAAAGQRASAAAARAAVLAQGPPSPRPPLHPSASRLRPAIAAQQSELSDVYSMDFEEASQLETAVAHAAATQSIAEDSLPPTHLSVTSEVSEEVPDTPVQRRPAAPSPPATPPARRRPLPPAGAPGETEALLDALVGEAEQHAADERAALEKHLAAVRARAAERRADIEARMVDEDDPGQRRRLAAALDLLRQEVASEEEHVARTVADSADRLAKQRAKWEASLGLPVTPPRPARPQRDAEEVLAEVEDAVAAEAASAEPSELPSGEVEYSVSRSAVSQSDRAAASVSSGPGGLAQLRGIEDLAAASSSGAPLSSGGVQESERTEAGSSLPGGESSVDEDAVIVMDSHGDVARSVSDDDSASELPGSGEPASSSGGYSEDFEGSSSTPPPSSGPSVPLRAAPEAAPGASGALAGLHFVDDLDWADAKPDSGAPSDSRRTSPAPGTAPSATPDGASSADLLAERSAELERQLAALQREKHQREQELEKLRRKVGVQEKERLLEQLRAQELPRIEEEIARQRALLEAAQQQASTQVRTEAAPEVAAPVAVPEEPVSVPEEPVSASEEPRAAPESADLVVRIADASEDEEDVAPAAPSGITRQVSHAIDHRVSGLDVSDAESIEAEELPSESESPQHALRGGAGAEGPASPPMRTSSIAWDDEETPRPLHESSAAYSETFEAPPSPAAATQGADASEGRAAAPAPAEAAREVSADEIAEVLPEAEASDARGASAAPEPATKEEEGAEVKKESSIPESPAAAAQVEAAGAEEQSTDVALAGDAGSERPKEEESLELPLEASGGVFSPDSSVMSSSSDEASDDDAPDAPASSSSSSDASGDAQPPEALAGLLKAEASELDVSAASLGRADLDRQPSMEASYSVELQEPDDPDNVDSGGYTIWAEDSIASSVDMSAEGLASPLPSLTATAAAAAVAAAAAAEGGGVAAQVEAFVDAVIDQEVCAGIADRARAARPLSPTELGDVAMPLDEASAPSGDSASEGSAPAEEGEGAVAVEAADGAPGDVDMGEELAAAYVGRVLDRAEELWRDAGCPPLDAALAEALLPRMDVAEYLSLERNAPEVTDGQHIYNKHLYDCACEALGRHLKARNRGIAARMGLRGQLATPEGWAEVRRAVTGEVVRWAQMAAGVESAATAGAEFVEAMVVEDMGAEEEELDSEAELELRAEVLASAVEDIWAQLVDEAVAVVGLSGRR